MGEKSHKVRNPAIAVVVSALLIAGFVKFVLWPPATEHKNVKFMAPVVSAPSPAQPKHSSWPGVSYLEVRAYYSREPFSAIRDGIPEPVDNKDGVLLNPDQERQLVAAVTADADPYIGGDCWFPRHAFVFRDPFGKTVANVVVCFDCLWAEGGPSAVPDIGALADLAVDLELPLGPNEDAEAFRRRLKRAQESAKNSS